MDNFKFIRKNPRSPKPRAIGMTEIRGPYYTMMGERYLRDVLETMHPYIDSLKFAGGSFTIIDPAALREIIDTCHEFEVMVSTGGFIEYVLTQGKEAVKKYISTCKDIGFDILEISSGFINISTESWLRVIEEVQRQGLKAKPEVGIQFGAGGATESKILESEGQKDTSYAIEQAKRFLDAGVYMIMIESEGITENTDPWRTNVPAEFINALGAEKLMFEAADPKVFEWYIRNFGNDINLFVDHSQIIQLECLRSGIWGTAESWGRVVGY
jgi:phosphosulfolactate synthase (CoM biosynthesis protein A)